VHGVAYRVQGQGQRLKVILLYNFYLRTEIHRSEDKMDLSALSYNNSRSCNECMVA
jgi:hypothetical protein